MCIRDSINTTWAFLFDTYGRQKYGTLPDWTGDPIDGRYAGADVDVYKRQDINT